MRAHKTRYYKTRQSAENRLAALGVPSPCLGPRFSYSILPAQHPKTGQIRYVVALMENGKLRAYCA